MNEVSQRAFKPEISVVLVVGTRRRRSADALHSILEQRGLERAEVIIVDAGGSGAGALPGQDHPRVRTCSMPPRSTFGELKAEGAQQARAPYVAYVEEHVLAQPGWLAGLLRAAEAGWDVIGVEVHHATPDLGFSEAVGWISYGLWFPPLAEGEAKIAPGNNSCYKRELLMQFDDQLSRLMTSDIVLQELLRAQGARFYLQPLSSIRHSSPTAFLPALKAELWYHWFYGAQRAHTFRWGLFQRAKYVLLAPAIAWLRWLRLVRLVRRKSTRPAASQARTALLAVLLVHTAVLGQTLGIALGPVHSERAFTQFELNGPRPSAFGPDR